MFSNHTSSAAASVQQMSHSLANKQTSKEVFVSHQGNVYYYLLLGKEYKDKINHE